MKQRLKIHLWRTNSTVHMQVLEQEGITYNLTDKISIGISPTMYSTWICLNGIKNIENDSIANFIFDDEQEAIDYINKVVSWLDEIFPSKEPKRGDIVLVNGNNLNDDYNYMDDERIFLTKIDGAENPFVCVLSFDENKFKNNEPFNICSYKLIQPLTSNWNSETGIYEAERDV